MPGTARHVTTLVTGRIGYAASAGAEEVVLEPNQQVSRDLAAGTVAVSAVDASVYGAWKEGWLWFENESLPPWPSVWGAYTASGGGGRPARGVYLLRENPPGQGRPSTSSTCCRKRRT